MKIDPRYDLRFKYPKWSRTVTVLDEPNLFRRAFPELTKADHLKLAENYARASGAMRQQWIDASERALKRYGDHGSLISGVVRDHFPETTKTRLRELAHGSSKLLSMAAAHWKAAGKRTPYHASPLHALSSRGTEFSGTGIRPPH